MTGDYSFEAQDGGNQGRGHGWRGMCTVFWNITCTGKPVVCQNAWATCSKCGKKWNQSSVCAQCGAELLPSGRNYAVGIKGIKTAHTVYWEHTNAGTTTNDFFLDMYGYGPHGENRPDGCWYPERAYDSAGGAFISLPYEAPVNWWPRLSSMNFSQPTSLYECQLEDRHAHNIFLNNL